MKNKFLAAAAAGLLSLSASSSLADNHANDDVKQQEDCMVKCYGIAQAGKNDCGSKDGSHGCAGMAKESCSDNEWVAIKASECEAAKCQKDDNGKTETNSGKYDSCIKKN